MNANRDRQRSGAPALVIVLAGALSVASAALHWVRFSFPATATAEANRFIGHMSVAVVFGVLLVLRGLGDFVVRGRGRVLILPVIAGGLIMGFATYDLATERTRAIQALVDGAMAITHLPAQQVSFVVRRQVEAGLVRITFLPGIYLASCAGLVAIIGGTMPVWARRGSDTWSQLLRPEGRRHWGLAERYIFPESPPRPAEPSPDS